jgi:hypothetical protein
MLEGRMRMSREEGDPKEDGGGGPKKVKVEARRKETMVVV